MCYPDLTRTSKHTNIFCKRVLGKIQEKVERVENVYQHGIKNKKVFIGKTNQTSPVGTSYCMCIYV